MGKGVLIKSLVIPTVLFLILSFGGAFVYTFLENWSYLDALYFSVVTATTVGYGDVVPVTVFGKIFTIFFAFCTISLAFYFFTLIGRYFLAKNIRRELLSSGRLNGKKGVRVIRT
jgi:voltage-gated potassium channel